jgi:hypothetical protein
MSSGHGGAALANGGEIHHVGHVRETTHTTRVNA